MSNQIAIYIYEDNNIEHITVLNQNELERIAARSEYFRGVFMVLNANQTPNSGTNSFRLFEVEKISNLPIISLRIPDVPAVSVLEIIDFLAKSDFDVDVNNMNVGVHARNAAVVRALTKNEYNYMLMNLVSNPEHFERIFQFIDVNDNLGQLPIFCVDTVLNANQTHNSGTNSFQRLEAEFSQSPERIAARSEYFRAALNITSPRIPDVPAVPVLEQFVKCIIIFGFGIYYYNFWLI